MPFKHASLQRLFLIPFLVLMICLASMMAVVVYYANNNVVTVIAHRNLDALNARVQSNIAQYLLSARAILNTIAPDPVQLNEQSAAIRLDFPQSLNTVEDRLWIATGLFPELINLAYYGAADGGFVSLHRLQNEGVVEIRERLPNEQDSHVYSMSGPHQKLALLRSDLFDARLRPWYRTAEKARAPVWSPVYIDFGTKIPLLTLAKPVYNASHQLTGVVATDVWLRQLNQFLQEIMRETQGLAYIVDQDGALIASSSGNIVYTKLDSTTIRRQHASDSSSELIRASYSEALRHMRAGQQTSVQYFEVAAASGEMHVTAMPIRDASGLEWISVIAVPHTNTMTEISEVAIKTLVFGGLAILLVLLLGYMILRWTLNDIRQLTAAVQGVSRGEPFAAIDIRRNDEIGVLASSFQEMERNLHSDSLTALLNRDAFASQVEFRRRRFVDKQHAHFAILFVDLNKFKEINDNFGHEAGDHVLIEVGKRLRHGIRNGDFAARFGGDEFVVYLHAVYQSETLQAIVEKLRFALNQPITLAYGKTGNVGAAIGAALYPDDGKDIDTLLRVADARMFADKQNGKIPEADDTPHSAS